MKRSRITLVSSLIFIGACGSSSSSSAPSGDDASVDSTIDDDASRDGIASDTTSATKANGTVGAWSTEPSLTFARANHCAAFGGGYLFVIGGNQAAGGGTFVKTDRVDAAKVNDDGSLAAWSTVGKMPSPVTECAAVFDHGTLYVVDGIFDDATNESKVWKATAGGDGTLTAFVDVGSLPPERRAISQFAWISGSTLYVTDGNVADADAGMGTTGVMRAPLAALSTWSFDDVDPIWRGRPEYAHTDAFVYFLGGYQAGSTAPILDVDGAKIQSGSVVGEFSTTKLSAPTMFGQAVAVDDWVFVVGGRDAAFGGTPRADVVSARIAADGTLGDFSAQASMPQPRSNFQLTLGGDWLYVTGGGDTGGGLADVWRARARF